jgi:hypothetical protein
VEVFFGRVRMMYRPLELDAAPTVIDIARQRR